MESCQLVLGYTQFHGGSVWNTMPAHVHDRRMEAYCYFDMDDDARVFHFMGKPEETRHIVIKNEGVVVSRRGPSIAVLAPAATPSSGAWAATMSTIPTWTSLQWVTCAKARAH